MRNTTRNLFWKEWHEQRWRMAFGCVLMSALPALGLMARVVPDEAVVTVAMLVGSVLLPIFAAMGLIAPERSERTLGSLLVLPVSSRTVLSVKTVVGLATCLAPLACATIVSLFMAGGRELSSGHIFMACQGSAVFACLVLVWTLAFSVRQSTEARVGLVGMGVVAAWVMLTMFMHMFWLMGQQALVEEPIVRAANPVLLLEAGFRRNWPSGYDLLLQGLLAVCLLWWAGRRVRQPGRQRS